MTEFKKGDRVLISSDSDILEAARGKFATVLKVSGSEVKLDIDGLPSTDTYPWSVGSSKLAFISSNPVSSYQVEQSLMNRLYDLVVESEDVSLIREMEDIIHPVMSFKYEVTMTSRDPQGDIEELLGGFDNVVVKRLTDK